MSTVRSTGRGSWFLLLLGVPFLGAGSFIGVLAARMVTSHLSARGWTETQATIQRVDLERRHSRKGGTSYKVLCAYTYIFEGRQYKGSRIGFSESADNIGSWHEDTYARLNEARGRNRAVPCFVNPADPTQALLDRELRFWLLVFMLLGPAVFGGVGAAFTAASTCGVLESRRRRRYAEAAGAADDQPWLCDPRWASGVIRSDIASKAAWAIGAAIFWNLVWSPVLFFLPGQVAKGDSLALLTLICPSIGLALIVWAVRAVIQNRKFGRSYFRCQPLPGVVGGRLCGELVLSGNIATLDHAEVTLRCRNTVTTRRHRKSSTQTNTLWEDKQVLCPQAARFGESEMRLAVDFEIPADCRPTDDSNSEDTVAWQLLVRAPAVGVDLSLAFEVPVFQTARKLERFREA